MTYLHKMKIIHWDIKPKNILVKSRYLNIFIKLFDLGLLSKKKHLQNFYNTEGYLVLKVVSMTLEYTI